MTDYDTREKVEKTDTGYRLTVESTRGTGTRDQDTVKAVARSEKLHELIEQRNAVTETVASCMNARRSHQPDAEEDE